MNRDVIIAMAKEATQDHEVRWSESDAQTVAFFLRLAALVAARERERVAQEFDRRAVLSDGGPAVGWYEPNEPAEIVRALNTEGEGNDRP